MIKMIASANFKNSDAKANFPADSGEPETDDFAALLDGMSFVIPPVVQQPVNTPSNFSTETAGGNSTDLQNFEDFSDGAMPPLPQFDEAVVLPETFAQVLPKDFSSATEKLFSKVADVSENTNVSANTGKNVSLAETLDEIYENPAFKTDARNSVIELKADLIETETLIQPAVKSAAQNLQAVETESPVNSKQEKLLAATAAETISPEAQLSPETTQITQSLPKQFAAHKNFSAENKNAPKDEQRNFQQTENTGETAEIVKASDKLIAQIENLQIEEQSAGDATSNFKLAENQLRPEILTNGEGKNEAPNKLPKLFREVSNFFEVADLTTKNQPRVAETAAPVSVEGANVAAQIEPQIAQMIALAIKTEKPQILKMRLNPAELGGVEIKIEKDEAGKINAHFRTEKEETRKILTENIAQLRDSLQDSGVQIDRVEVSCDANSFAGNEARENSSQAEKDAARNSFAQTSDSSGQANTKEDLNSEKSNRLLSVRA